MSSTMDLAWNYLINGSVISAASTAYMFAWNEYFWSVFFLVMVVVIAVKVDNPVVVPIAVLIGNVALGVYLMPIFKQLFTVILILTTGVALYKLYVSGKED